ncbi:hypothetical protein SAMN02745857_03818 [Andreprevotia lacus DSM 23236]|jgi:hypothetical protein|uniref:Uncharacterized protein n=1 Tax=Andreprevotia lacus DSM 23236 TaxID=1121001 RepID=A0A1W1XZV6_9NEIS|nr:hypothetical protein [Andreprevotia lacus]SMC29405.1 hypothetical protein SAMN02745857_03818 [Andreprevotia lacus DSM 23236]
MKRILIATLFTLAAGLSFADGDLTPRHGGVVVEAKSGHKVELVAQSGMLTLYLFSHDGKPVDSKGAGAEITLLAGSDKSTAKFEASGENTLMAHGKFNTAAGAKAIVKFTLPGKAAEQVRLSF